MGSTRIQQAGDTGQKGNIDFAAGNFWNERKVADGGTRTLTSKYRYLYLRTSNIQMSSRSPLQQTRALRFRLVLASPSEH